ncbi:polymeric immunoglobulin receptor-like isoform X2 [Myxocyprinus asiaticus]|uniref:polymeric immunoglobulin receptor-like isoform X2 n=1 Tax=Myxocyprinus asiaticus TaxID=70543 RepID=UPI002222A182|nr:polymeric immunoglobulin receptor-like isoform X2 [Myxocyprinus asiaticus]
MNIILTFTLLMIPGAVTSIIVTGYSGGGVIISCKYEKQYKTNVKYFCRGQWSTCSDLIRTDMKDKLVQKEKVYLYDNTRAAVFILIIRHLKKQDTDKYYCGIYRPVALDSKTEVHLKVREGDQIRTVRGYSGGSVIINSKYEHEHKWKLKYFLRTETLRQYSEQISTKKVEEWQHNGRFSIHDNRSADLLQVFITELDVEDSGDYTVVFKVSEDYSFFSELNLVVNDDGCCENIIRLAATSEESVNVSCRYPQSHRSDRKFLCRRSGTYKCSQIASVNESRRWTLERQFHLYGDREDQLLTVSISNVTQHNSGEYWCGVESDQQYMIFITQVQLTVTETCRSNITSVSPLSSDWSLIISLSVVLVLIFVGLLLLIVALYKRRQTQGADSSSKVSHIGPGQNEVVPQKACDYEEITDIRLYNDSDTGRSTVYSTEQIAKNPFDSIQTTVQLLTKPSDFDIALYSTVQDPRSDRSAEDLNYAVVNFHKKPDCADRINFSNNQNDSDYATVSYDTV